jgi:hypothetical protein
VAHKQIDDDDGDTNDCLPRPCAEKSKATSFMPSQEPKRTTCFKNRAFTKAETGNELTNPGLTKNEAYYMLQIWEPSQKLKRATSFKHLAFTKAGTHNTLRNSGLHKS